MTAPESNYPVTEFPSFTEQEVSKLAGSYSWLCLLVLHIVLAIVVAGVWFALVLADDPNKHQFISYWPWSIPLWLLLSVFIWVQAKVRGYAVRERDISYYSGVVFRRTVVQPVTRLQHIEVARGPLERMFGLATLKLFSAGGALHTMAIPGLPLDKAERLRAYILDCRELANDQ